MVEIYHVTSYTSYDMGHAIVNWSYVASIMHDINEWINGSPIPGANELLSAYTTELFFVLMKLQAKC